MKVLSINNCNFGSTGNIMLQINSLLSEQGHDTINAYPVRRQNATRYVKNKILIGSTLSRNIHFWLGQAFGVQGELSVTATARFLKKVDEFSPDVIHLHNLHVSYINLPMLFNYIKKHNVKVVWTLHDCWAFTGHCPHFTVVKCDKWKTGCYSCPQFRKYPQSYVDHSKRMYAMKKRIFTGVNDLTIVTPSQWLGDLTKESFLGEYPVKVINNGIDLGIFKPTQSDFRKKYGLENKKIVLGVAFEWCYSKGLDVFNKLADDLSDEYKVVLVGIKNENKKNLNSKILSISRTSSAIELAQIYSAADLFVNPTREDNFPTVNMESLACGTPVLTYNTGGCPEMLDDTCGRVSPYDNYDALLANVEDIFAKTPFTEQSCVKKASEYDKNIKFAEYVSLYNELFSKNNS
ncbi:MAG: glycosyltransferase [Clostridiales bacterium]|nr:glycosyltransferase [Clostridiales bacterium]